MSCNRNGIKREGESCTKNNQCTYPACMKQIKTGESGDGIKFIHTTGVKVDLDLTHKIKNMKIGIVQNNFNLRDEIAVVLEDYYTSKGVFASVAKGKTISEALLNLSLQVAGNEWNPKRVFKNLSKMIENADKINPYIPDSLNWYRHELGITPVEEHKAREQKINDGEKSCYYAHSMALYGTEQEKRDVALIESLGFKVVNPNSELIQQQVESVKMWGKEAGKSNDEIGAEIMQMFFSKVIPECDALAFRSFTDGKIGAGVWGEVQCMKKLDRPVFELPTILSTRAVSIEDTREMLRLLGQR